MTSESLIERLRKHVGKPANRYSDYISWATVEEVFREHGKATESTGNKKRPLLERLGIVGYIPSEIPYAGSDMGVGPAVKAASHGTHAGETPTREDGDRLQSAGPKSPAPASQQPDKCNACGNSGWYPSGRCYSCSTQQPFGFAKELLQNMKDCPPPKEAVYLTEQPDDCADQVERVAIAICPWFNGSRDGEDPKRLWEDMYPRYKEAYREQARAAIAAMKRESIHPFTDKELKQIRPTVAAMRLQMERNGLWQPWWIKFIEWALSEVDRRKSPDA